jgi:hypothetical protein
MDKSRSKLRDEHKRRNRRPRRTPAEIIGPMETKARAMELDVLAAGLAVLRRRWTEERND